METLKTITPVHIGSGKSIWAIKMNDYLYSVDKVIEFNLNSMNQIQLNNLKFISSNNVSKQDFFRIMNINKFNLPDSAILYGKNYAKYVIDVNKDLFFNQRTLDKLIIPGSSIKGLINNLFWYYIVNESQEIKNEMIKSIIEQNRKNAMNERNGYRPNDKTFSKTINDFNNVIKNLQSFLRIRDVIIEDEPMVYTVNRYNSKNEKMPVGNIETIPANIIVKQEIICELNEQEKKLMEKVINEIKNNDRNYNRIKDILLKGYYNFLCNIKSILPTINKAFMKEILNQEIEFIKSSGNNLDKPELLSIYSNLQKELDKGKFIVQIGKFTNYLDKTFMFALEEVYKNNFKDLFKPNPKKKHQNIESMNLIPVNNSFVPLGFIEIEL